VSLGLTTLKINADMATKTKVAGDTVEKPGIRFPKETYMFWYETMVLMRRFEEKAGQMYGQQKIRGFCHLYIGQEACAAGAASALVKGDKYITSYRDHAHPLCLGTEPKYIMAELFGKATGVSKGKGGSMHIFDKDRGFFGGHGIVGGQIPLGVGIAFAEKYNKTGKVCVTFMGDGAVRQGSFHESLNLAMTYKLPVIFAIENNGYAMGTSVARTSNVHDLYTLGKAYEMPSRSVDAMKVEEVHDAIAESAENARNGIGPTLLELRTYRYKGHSMSDPAKYRTKEELEAYKKRDPIEQVKDSILANGFATEKDLEAIEDQIKIKVEESVKFAEESPFPAEAESLHEVYEQKDYPFIEE
jgi:pyruvate dehydrogenase E1 component alpha subunit